MTGRFFGRPAPLKSATPQDYSSTRDVSVTPARRETPAYVIDHGRGDLPFAPDPERDRMAQQAREQLQKLFPGRVFTTTQASG